MQTSQEACIQKYPHLFLPSLLSPIKYLQSTSFFFLLPTTPSLLSLPMDSPCLPLLPFPLLLMRQQRAQARAVAGEGKSDGLGHEVSRGSGNWRGGSSAPSPSRMNPATTSPPTLTVPPTTVTGGLDLVSPPLPHRSRRLSVPHARGSASSGGR